MLCFLKRYFPGQGETGPEVIKLFSCSTQLSTKFQLLIKTEIPTKKFFFALSLSDVVFIMLINVKLPTIVDILTFGPRREKTCLRGFANNTVADKPAHLRSLISAFVILFLGNFICKLASGDISIF